MKILDVEILQKLTFPDFNIEKMELLPKEKKLKILVDGAWLDEGNGILLGKGFLLFSMWENLSIRRLDSKTEKWSRVEESNLEYLNDLCEIKFLDSIVVLCGFGKKSGQWLEWKIVNAKMYAEFEQQDAK